MSEILSREFLMEELPNLTPDAILAHDAALRAENERLKDMIEIEREGQRSMARALSEINRLSRLDVAIALAAPPEEESNG